MTKIQKLILALIIIIFFVVITLTAVTITTGAGIPAKNLRKTDPTPNSLIKTSQLNGTPEKIYMDLGTLRCLTADVPAIPIVITPYFSYPADDKAFFEELTSKNKKLQQIILQYIKTKTQKELYQMNEKAVKEELIKQFNTTLIMGKITTLYFDEYIFLK
jgi:flagellar FliL protein